MLTHHQHAHPRNLSITFASAAPKLHNTLIKPPPTSAGRAQTCLEKPQVSLKQDRPDAPDSSSTCHSPKPAPPVPSPPPTPTLSFPTTAKTSLNRIHYMGNLLFLSIQGTR
ncbi:hypothetical protein CDAR_30161 [Caerostris darwini]|uniref:Uncharacterized protein n=1 Tax=Caerostris darwini TaxID=1538125 RepID=A0AAV4NPZ6_9ARAC|nr:hypothetical protein CDAR_30161 [Caerostris darwini]